MHCEPTYEELKLREKIQNETGIEDCEPTYEELKLGREFPYREV